MAFEIIKLTYLLHGPLVYWTFAAIFTGCLLAIALNLNSVYSPGKHFTPPSLLTCLNLITNYLPSKTLHSSNTNLLARPSGMTGNFTSQAFSVSTPSTCNLLPTHIRSFDTLNLQMSTKISPLPVRFRRLVTLCQHLGLVLQFWRYIYLYVCMYVHVIYKILIEIHPLCHR